MADAQQLPFVLCIRHLTPREGGGGVRMRGDSWGGGGGVCFERAGGFHMGWASGVLRQPPPPVHPFFESAKNTHSPSRSLAHFPFGTYAGRLSFLPFRTFVTYK